MIAACGAAWTWQRSRVHVYRYELAVAVDTPAGLRRGSTVRELRWQRMPAPVPDAHPADVRQRGEAAMVDLPDGKTLFLLLDDNPRDTVLAGFHGIKEGMHALSTAAARRAVQDFPSRATLRQHLLDWPRAVMFRNPADPASVEIIDLERLGTVIGDGYALRRLTIQVTDAPITTGIERRLPWLSAIGRQRATLIPDPPRLLKDVTQKQRIKPSSFSTELYK